MELGSFESIVVNRMCLYMRMEIAADRRGDLFDKDRYAAVLRGLIEGLFLSLNPSFVGELETMARKIVNEEMEVGTDEG